ncbi:protein phosphatase 2C domain-containing protein [Pseudomonas sp.]|jgi:hypothetical protein|uniref:protein phosphatase 2C domain-containing protein n=1 Tax=Pseudomonas sp. TaxID=306 RepID=UPI002E2FCB60|nr:protein phosphatase 2C domain-containing protein [Pseudomonas sp.]HEX4551970.1 protein phosphatase 2C domain-containing protein [Pseudomonas sp.]
MVLILIPRLGAAVVIRKIEGYSRAILKQDCRKPMPLSTEHRAMPDLPEVFICKTAFAAVAGRSQPQTPAPRQHVAARASNGVTCIALADGADGADRSDIGAQVAVTAALAYVCKNFESLWQNMDKHNAKAAQRLVHRCLDALRRKSAKVGCSINDLTCSLAFVACSQGRYMAGHLGAGVIVSMDPDGKLATLSPPENTESGRTGVFLTDPKAVSKLSLYRGPIEAPAGFAILSDGAARSLFQPAGTTVAPTVLNWLELNATSPRKKFKAVLAEKLQQSIASESADDCALGLLSILRRDVSA